MTTVVDSEIWRERVQSEETPGNTASWARARYAARDAFRAHYEPRNCVSSDRSTSPAGISPYSSGRLQGPFATLKGPFATADPNLARQASYLSTRSSRTPFGGVAQ
eukprot:470359-Pleurochrysis_carterae.AAC.1